MLGCIKSWCSFEGPGQRMQCSFALQIVDHLQNTDHWNPLHEHERSWRPASSWMEGFCKLHHFPHCIITVLRIGLLVKYLARFEWTPQTLWFIKPDWHWWCVFFFKQMNQWIVLATPPRQTGMVTTWWLVNLSEITSRTTNQSLQQHLKWITSVTKVQSNMEHTTNGPFSWLFDKL